MAAAQVKLIRIFLVIAACLPGVSCAPKPKAAQAEPVAEIRVGEDDNAHRLLQGFYESHGAWRWTAPSFTLLLDPPESKDKTFLVMDCTMPVELMTPASSVTLRARVNGVNVGQETYTRTGRYFFQREVPTAALDKKPAQVEFSLDRSVPNPPDAKPLGLIAVRIGFYDEFQTPEWEARVLKAAREEYPRLYRNQPSHFTLEQDAMLKKLFHELPVWESLQFLGVPILKNPLDLWTMQHIIYEVRPDFIIETGTLRGGSALFWAHTLEGLGLEHSRVLTVDIEAFAQTAALEPLWKKYVDFYLGSSVDADIVEQIRRRVQGKKVLVTLDALHTAGHVLKELRAYGPMVSPGSYIVVEDTHLDGVPTHGRDVAGPLSAVTEFLRQGGNRDFTQDLSREGFGTTWNPGGWLRRK